MFCPHATLDHSNRPQKILLIYLVNRRIHDLPDLVLDGSLAKGRQVLLRVACLTCGTRR